MSVRLYPKEPKIKDTTGRRFHVTYFLCYDLGSEEWVGYYRTKIGARIAAWWNVHIFSWGGTADLDDMRERTSEF
jgi:hypothetical protein